MPHRPRSSTTGACRDERHVSLLRHRARARGSRAEGVDVLDRQHGDVVFECDGCGEVLETDTADFGSALNMLKREGWRARKFDNVWQHYCGACEMPRAEDTT